MNTYEMTLEQFTLRAAIVTANTFYPKWEYKDTIRPAGTKLERKKAFRGFHRDDIMAAINEGKLIPATVIAEYPELSHLID